MILTQREQHRFDVRGKGVPYGYPILVREAPDWQEFRLLFRALHADHITLVADAHLPQEMVQPIYEALCQVAPTLQLAIPADERQKTIETARSIWRAARANGGGTQQSCFVALGGGTIGNITGLAALLLTRGIRLVHIPTTLLAGTDSVLSLKQGVNEYVGTMLIKNLVGNYLAPQFVLEYLSYWQSLPATEIRSGVCELIKNVVAIRPDLFHPVKAFLKADAGYTIQDYAQILAWSVQAKQQVMQDDAFEKGTALVLEAGHAPIGHAIEAAATEMHMEAGISGQESWTRHDLLEMPGRLPHGFAIVLGLLASAHISRARGLQSDKEVRYLYELVEQNGAPTTLPPSLSPQRLLSIMKQDNKRGALPAREGYHAMVLLEHLGRPVMHGQIPMAYVSDQEVLFGLSALARA
ncbi:3-dehydroquinate synthase [Reticulibacter mediterranei]|uniref:3-dehydroquinate synthase n=1 Tax=Reticulibacter mediterranei TaxID=2778369 RepID=A0A8J3IZJ5_9CHLR|nr:iron-containing alcohol dehydrogenase [Reticulibacter mediterranei]GHP00880.1 3-dehydroquinate synthase [Reticulibacter mediterranei]